MHFLHHKLHEFSYPCHSLVSSFLQPYRPVPARCDGWKWIARSLELKKISFEISKSNFILKKSLISNVSASDIIIATDDPDKILASHIKSWLSSRSLQDFSVLNFDSLYFDIKYNNVKWWNTIDNALVFCNYQQLC